MRAPSVLLFHSQRPFSVFGLPYPIILGALLLFFAGLALLSIFEQLFAMIVFGGAVLLGMFPVIFACRKDHHADRVFLSSSWWKRQRLRRFAAGGPYRA